MTWILWVGVLVTTFCVAERPCLAPYTMQATVVRHYATEADCARALPQARQEFERVWDLLDHPSAHEWQGPPAERTLTLWCAPEGTH
jgi:hypothetical protein